MAKSTKIIAALGVAAGLGVAAMPLATFAADSDVTELTDSITVTVEDTCSFTTGNDASATSNTFTGSAVNGAEVADFGTDSHKFNVVCNKNSGYNVKATATGLTDSSISKTLAYKGLTDYNSAVSTTANDGAWHVTLTSTDAQINDNGTETTIVNKSAATDTTGIAFTAKYSVYVGKTTPAGSYEGSVVYTLTAN